MALFDPDFLKRLDYLALLARRTGGSALLAAAAAKVPGGGTEVTALRDYAPGDDYRHVDWVCCARRDDLLTKVFEGVTDLHTYLLVDCSASMAAGSPAKFHVARQIAAALGYLAMGRLDRLGVATFADDLTAAWPLLCHKTRFPRLLRLLEELSVQQRPTNLARTAETFVRRYQRHGQVVILSDAYDPGGFQRGLEILRYHGYQPRLVQIHDPREADPHLSGDIELYDVETRTVRQATITERMTRRYRVLFTQFQDSLRDYCTKHAIPHVSIACAMPEDQVLRTVVCLRKGDSPIFVGRKLGQSPGRHTP